MIRIIKWMAVLLATGVFLVLAAGCGTNGEKPTAQSYTLSLAHFFPPAHPAETELIRSWAEAIAEATDGRVMVDSYPGEQLYKAADIYEGVVNGAADIGLSCFAYTRGRFPVLEVFELPGIIYPNSRVASMTAWEGIKALNPAEVQDTKLLMVLATGPGDLFTTTPVSCLEDLQGLKIRATGLSAETLRILGAVPDAMPQSDAYEALQRGLVQGNLSPVEVLQGWRHAEVTQYLTETPFIYNTLFFVTMNRDKWDSFPADIQETIDTVTEKIFTEVAIGLWDKQNQDALQWALEEQEMQLIQLTEEETARWIELIKPIQEDFVAKMDAQGQDGRLILETVQTLAEEYAHLYR